MLFVAEMKETNCKTSFEGDNTLINRINSATSQLKSFFFQRYLHFFLRSYWLVIGYNENSFFFINQLRNGIDV